MSLAVRQPVHVAKTEAPTGFKADPHPVSAHVISQLSHDVAHIGIYVYLIGSRASLGNQTNKEGTSRWSKTIPDNSANTCTKGTPKNRFIEAISVNFNTKCLKQRLTKDTFRYTSHLSCDLSKGCLF